MNTLLVKIRNDLQTARQAHNKVQSALISTLVGEIETDAKNKIETNDKYIVKKLKMYVSNIETYYEKYSDEAKAKADTELQWLKGILSLVPAEPEKLSTDELHAIVQNFNTVGECFAHLKQNYAGRFDGSVVTQYFKSK